MQKKVVLLTGHTGTLGRELVKLLDDYIVIGVARKKPEPDISKIYSIQGDICNDSKKIVEICLKKYGKIDYLINNAFYPLLSPIKDLCEESMMEQYRTNVIAQIGLANCILNQFWIGEDPEYNRASNRAIINISSTSGTHNYFGRGQASYAATKAALNIFTFHLAHECDTYGIRVNGVAPTSFPQLVETNLVASSVIDLMKSKNNGTVQIIDVN